MNESQLLERLTWRYSVKKFDPTKKLTASQWSAIEQAMVLSPSSYGLQPWKFLVVQTPDLRKTLRAATWNQPQVEDCSHFIVFTSKVSVTEPDVDRYLARMSSVREVPLPNLEKLKTSIVGDVVKGPRSLVVQTWASRQAYIALGQTMAAAAMIGVDTCPIEGLEPARYDHILGLNASGYSTLCALAVGFRHQDDWLAKAKKVRFPAEEVVQYR